LPTYTENFFFVGFTARETDAEKVAAFENIEKERTKSIKAFIKETEVINPLVAYSQHNKLGLKIFPGINITKSNLRLLSYAITSGFDKCKFKEDKEIDAVVIGKSAIYLIETKSSIHGVFVSLISLIEVGLSPGAHVINKSFRNYGHLSVMTGSQEIKSFFDQEIDLILIK
jgi:hypothetical protein